MNAETPQARVFFALVPDAALRRRLAELAIRVAQSVEGRAIPEDQIHLTLVFLGNVARAFLDEVRAAASTIQFPPFELGLATLGRFPRSDVTWIGPAGEVPAVKALANALAERLATIGLVFDRRDFHAHVTLARRSERAPALPDVALLDWRVERYVLMESVSVRSGVSYRQLGAWPLE